MIPRLAPRPAHPLAGISWAKCENAPIESRQKHWDDRYRERTVAAPHAPEILALNPEMAALVPASGRALDVACGRGAQTAWLAGRGLEVVALDVSGVAIALTDAAAAAVGVAHRVDARQENLDNGLPDDLQEFDIIVCQRFRNREVLEALGTRLRPNGVAFVTVLSSVGLDRAPGKFHAPADELLEVFTRDYIEVVWHLEADGIAAIVIRRT
jgi:2-polyprenyl-3-methyl-5-hydroxy-6-metoxy-1,4-benzoquinol methylase